MQLGFTARTSNAPLPEDTVARVANRATAEKAKKKDDEKTRKARREKVRLDRGKWHQGSEEEEDTEEDNDVQ
jgi:hypothetical protein